MVPCLFCTDCLGAKQQAAAARLLPHALPLQMSGCVNLNCCSTFRAMVPQSRQRKVPRNSSGRTSLVRVTVPCMACCSAAQEKLGQWGAICVCASLKLGQS